MGSHWLLRVITQDSRTTANVIANVRQLMKDGALKLHPIITRLVDGETLKKMGAVQTSASRPGNPDLTVEA